MEELPKNEHALLSEANLLLSSQKHLPKLINYWAEEISLHASASAGVLLFILLFAPVTRDYLLFGLLGASLRAETNGSVLSIVHSIDVIVTVLFAIVGTIVLARIFTGLINEIKTRKAIELLRRLDPSFKPQKRRLKDYNKERNGIGLREVAVGSRLKADADARIRASTAINDVLASKGSDSRITANDLQSNEMSFGALIIGYAWIAFLVFIAFWATSQHTPLWGWLGALLSWFGLDISPAPFWNN
jgi:hypothetical protein